MKRLGKVFLEAALIVVGVIMFTTTKVNTEKVSTSKMVSLSSTATTQSASGTANVAEYTERIEIAKLGIKSSVVKAFVQKYDTNKDGYLSYSERRQNGAHHYRKKAVITQEDVAILFKVFPEFYSFHWYTGNASKIKFPDTNNAGIEIISTYPSLVKINADVRVRELEYTYQGTKKATLDFKKASGYKNMRRITVKGKNIVGVTIPDKTTWFSIHNASISEYVLSGHSKLKNFSISGNKKLTKLTVTDCPKLYDIYCVENKLSKLSVSNCQNLQQLSCNDNKLKKIDFRKCKKINGLNCTNNQFSTIDVSWITKLDDFRCSGNNLSSLNLKNNPKLTALECANNKLHTLSLSANKKLRTLVCFGNKFNRINLSANKKLNIFHIGSNYTLLQDVRPEVQTYMFMKRGQKLNLASYASSLRKAKFNRYITDEDFGVVYGIAVSKKGIATMDKAKAEKNRYYYGDFFAKAEKKSYYFHIIEGENSKCDYNDLYAVLYN